MNKNKLLNLLEYLSTTLIFSYFFIHNIILVLIGLTFLLYSININFINDFIKYLNDKIPMKKLNRELNKNNKAKEAVSNKKQLNKEESKLTLVETVEELGFIPSLESNDDIKAA